MAEGEESVPLVSREGDEGQDNEGYEGWGDWWVGENPSDPHRRRQATTSGDPNQHFEMVAREREQHQEDARRKIQNYFPDWDP